MNHAKNFTLAAGAAGLLALAAPAAGMTATSVPPQAPQDSQYAKDSADQSRMAQIQIPAEDVPSWYAANHAKSAGAPSAAPRGS
ncbi:MAG TPA: hypothetical protein VMK12_04300 [Anaeromyxobacteraceae bacterium]|nr:hypothetical protein [Anaeromyxobacteraceae bacterium]